MKPFEHQTVLVWDQGLYTHVAAKLAEQFGTVLYYCDWRSAFPYSGRAMIGLGLPGVTRVRNGWDHVDQADLIVFCDCYFSAEQEFLRKRLGKRVYGSGSADSLELYRGDLKQIMQQVGLPVGPYEEVVGVTALREYLLHNDDVFVKASLFRGDAETFHSPNYLLSRQHIDEMAAHLGPRQDSIHFVVEHRLDGPELGFDGSCILGQFSDTVAWGYEDKDQLYLGQVCAYDDLPDVLKEVNAKLAPLMAELDARGSWSTEVRKVGNKAYLMDPCARFGSPPSEVYIDAFLNWPSHFWYGAEGKVENLEPAGRYMAEIILRSSVTEKSFLAIQFPEEYRSNIKIHGHAILDGIDYAVPLGIREFGAAVGVADSLAEAEEIALEAAQAIKADGIEFEESFSGAHDKLEEGEAAGVEW